MQLSWILAALSCAWITDDEWATRTDVYSSDCGEIAWWLDEDGDGYGGGEGIAQCAQPQGYVAAYGDCDDSDPDTNPGATERCDGVNNDCDARIDEDAPDARTFFKDRDGDGYGDAHSTTTACEQPGGDGAPAWVPRAGDCDDANPDISPGADEVCDGIDNNCDDAIDVGAVDALGWFEDGDGDGYGQGAISRGCEQPEGTSVLDGDCDDANSSISPGADEVCGDGVDNDCDGRIGADCLITGQIALDSDEAWVGWSDAEAGAALSGAGDMDGDGLADLLIGAPGIRRAILVSAADAPGGELLDGVQIVGPVSTGEAVSGVGDLDLDGYGELLLGAPDEADDDGAAWLIYGPVTESITLDEDPVGARFTGAGRLGIAVSGANTVDGDLSPDILLGADHAEDLAGVAYLFYGPVLGEKDVRDDADAMLYGPDGGRAGRALTGVGDVDGDGLGDLLIGSPGQDRDAGAAWLVSGPVSGAHALEDIGVGLLGVASGDRAGSRVAAGGDNNGDGYSDLLIGAFRDGDGVVYLVHGPVEEGRSLAGAEAVIVGAAFGGRYDPSLAAQDYDDDGLWDVLIGAPEEGSAGAVFGLLAPVIGGVELARDADIQWSGSARGDRLGTAVRRVNDADGDGYGELLVGAPGASEAAGAAWLLQAGGL